jgi:hypothetical protein
MLISWQVRYLDRNDKRFKDRVLFLDTDTLPPATKAAVEIIEGTKSSGSNREWLRFRSLFREKSPDDVRIEPPQDVTRTSSFALSDYFEDETGAELPWRAIGPILSGDPKTFWLPGGAKQRDMDLKLAEPTPIPLTEVSLTPEEIRLLGYFARDIAELSGSAFMKDGPGTLKLFGLVSSPTSVDPVLETAVTEDEIRSFVTIFRRLYMENELANFKKAVAVYVKSLGDHPLAKWVAAVADDYGTYLESPPHVYFLPLAHLQQLQFTTKRLLDVFIYTRYAHQPKEERQRQFNECLGQVEGRQSLLAWMFLTEIWACSRQMGIAGRMISDWFRHYCDHHGLSPDVLNSLQQDHHGIGTVEKDEERRARLIHEKVEELEMEMWKQAGRPEGGPVQFRATARDQLMRALQG